MVCLHKQGDGAGGSAATWRNIANATQQANEELPRARLASSRRQSSRVSACAHASRCSALWRKWCHCICLIHWLHSLISLDKPHKVSYLVLRRQICSL